MSREGHHICPGCGLRWGHSGCIVTTLRGVGPDSELNNCPNCNGNKSDSWWYTDSFIDMVKRIQKKAKRKEAHERDQ